MLLINSSQTVTHLGRVPSVGSVAGKVATTGPLSPVSPPCRCTELTGAMPDMMSVRHSSFLPGLASRTATPFPLGSPTRRGQRIGQDLDWNIHWPPPEKDVKGGDAFA